MRSGSSHHSRERESNNSSPIEWVSGVSTVVKIQWSTAGTHVNQGYTWHMNPKNTLCVDGNHIDLYEKLLMSLCRGGSARTYKSLRNSCWFRLGGWKNKKCISERVIGIREVRHESGKMMSAEKKDACKWAVRFLCQRQCTGVSLKPIITSGSDSWIPPLFYELLCRAGWYVRKCSPVTKQNILSSR